MNDKPNSLRINGHTIPIVYNSYIPPGMILVVNHEGDEAIISEAAFLSAISRLVDETNDLMDSINNRLVHSLNDGAGGATIDELLERIDREIDS